MRRFLYPLLVCALALTALTAGCGDSDDSGATAAAETAKAETTAKRVSGPTEAVLRPVGDTKASGRVRYLKKPDGTPLVRIRAKGLEPVSGDRQYVIWQVASRHEMVILATYYVDKDRRLNEDLPASFASLGALEDGSRTELLITKVENNDILWDENSRGEDAYDPIYIGNPVLRGTFTGSLVGESGGE